MLAGALAAAGVALAPSLSTAATLKLITPYTDALGGTTEVHGLNDSGWMTGSIDRPDGSYVGFIRDAAGHYTTFSYDTSHPPGPASTLTQGRAIDDANNVTAWVVAPVFTPRLAEEVLRHPDGSHELLTNVITGDVLHGAPGGFDGSGHVVGDYYLPGLLSPRHGYELTPGGLVDIAVTGNPVTAARGINDDGTVVGFMQDESTSTDVGFIYRGGVFMSVFHPGAANVTLQDINNNGIAVGSWNDSTGAFHPFLYDLATTTFTDLVVPGGGTAWAINDLNQVVISNSLQFGGSSYLYDPCGAPEPAVWANMILGFSLAGAALRRRRLAHALR